MELSFLRHEGVALVCQNNEAQSVQVIAMNPLLLEMTGYGEEEVKGLPLLHILGSRTAELVTDYLELEQDRHDLQDVLGRAREVFLRRKDGSEMPAPNFRIYRIEAKDRHHWFRLVTEEDAHKREAEQFKALLRENFKGHEVLDAETNLPDRASIEKDLELAQFYADSRGLSACFTYVRLDAFDILAASQGREVALQALTQSAEILRRNLRAEDAIGRVAENALGLILMDITPESFRLVMNRLRGNIIHHEIVLGNKPQKLAASFCYAPIAGNGAPSLLLRCAERLLQEGDASVLVALD
jgi:PAS domain S-box-containing protein